VIVAGASPAVARVSPVLDRLGQRLFLLGDDPGAANLMKVAANALTALTLQSMGEVLALTGPDGYSPRRPRPRGRSATRPADRRRVPRCGPPGAQERDRPRLYVGGGACGLGGRSLGHSDNRRQASRPKHHAVDGFRQSPPKSRLHNALKLNRGVRE
jgi:hypothetical protein